MGKHTPGPWKLTVPYHTFKNSPYRTGTFEISSGEKAICHWPWSRTTGDMIEESEANGQLIAVAPELLGKLVSIVGVWKSIRQWHADIGLDKQISEAEQLIAKAKGGGL